METSILIAEDDLASRFALQSVLEKWGYEVEAARDGTEAWEMLQADDAPKLAILDWMMPGLDGLEVCRRTREAGGEYTYLILLTGRGLKGDLATALEEGFDDYLSKPFERAELAARLAVGRRILELQRRLILSQRRLEEEATHDPLTGLWNRRAMVDALRRDLSRATRDGGPLSLALVDLDHFKRVNDTYGHHVGDAVLVEAAARLRGSLRGGDAVARWGGEELLLMLSAADVWTSRDVADRLRATFADQPFVVGEGLSLRVTASFGLAQSEPQESWEDLVRRADEALYRAKRAGRNRVEWAAPRPVPLACGLAEAGHGVVATGIA